MLIVPLLVMPLHGQHGEDEDEHAEDDSLHQAHEKLEAVEGKRNVRNGNCGDDGESKLTAVNVAEEAHRQREWLDELQEEFDHANKEADGAALKGEELSKVPAKAERSHALIVEVDEGDERQAYGDVDVARWRAELMHSANAWNQA